MLFIEICKVREQKVNKSVRMRRWERPYNFIIILPSHVYSFLLLLIKPGIFYLCHQPHPHLFPSSNSKHGGWEAGSESGIIAKAQTTNYKLLPYHFFLFPLFSFLHWQDWIKRDTSPSSIFPVIFQISLENPFSSSFIYHVHLSYQFKDEETLDYNYSL